jgi:hypothetical protein
MRNKHEIQLKCMKLSKLEREREYRINMINDTGVFPLAAQSLDLQDPEHCRRSQHLNNSDRKQET